MKWLIILAVAFLTNLTAGTNTAADSITFSGSATVSLDGEMESFIINESGQITEAETNLDILDEVVEVVTPGGLPSEENVLFFNAYASYVGNKVAYQIGLEHDSFSDRSTATFNLNTRISEDWTLKARDPDAIIPNLDLVGRYVFSARVEHEFASYAKDTSGAASGDPYSVSVFAGIDVGTANFASSIFGDAFSADVSKSFGVRYGIAGQSAGNIGLEFNTSLDIPPDGLLGVFSRNSFDLVRVEFEDGTTPEEHGFDFVRASGRLSPNVTVIPKPGDYTGDGLVDAADYQLWDLSYGLEVSPFSSADGNGDGRIGAADYTVWRDAYSVASAAASAPEPAAAVLAFIAMLTPARRV